MIEHRNCTECLSEICKSLLIMGVNKTDYEFFINYIGLEKHLAIINLLILRSLIVVDFLTV